MDTPRFVEPTTFVGVAPRWWVSNFGGMLAFAVVATRSRSRLMRAGFGLAVALHVGEALYGYDKARRAGFHTSASRWGLQTLAVGFPSLVALHDAIDESVTERAPATT
jgi:hypothetical protein